MVKRVERLGSRRDEHEFDEIVDDARARAKIIFVDARKRAFFVFGEFGNAAQQCALAAAARTFNQRNRRRRS